MNHSAWMLPGEEKPPQGIDGRTIRVRSPWAGHFGSGVTGGQVFSETLH